MKFRLWVLMLLLLAAGMVAVHGEAQDDPSYWPTDAWPRSSPEAQGMDSERLGDMFTAIHDQDLNIHGVVIVRNGYIVAESYMFPYDETVLHDLRSATKSVTSALIGIALGQGAILSTDQPLLDFFPARSIANLDAAKRAITLRHLLTMSSGLDWPTEGFNERLLQDYYLSRDWAGFVLDLPMAYSPGEHFAYNSGGSNLLGAIIEQTTGMDALTFARQNLFAPLGITRVSWMTDPSQAFYLGSMGMRLTPRDMAKLGYLYLNSGRWDAQQIIPAAWVTESTHSQISAEPMSEGYGYQWWIREGCFMATGYGGQYIIVKPDQRLVAVFTGGIPPDSSIIEELFDVYILPAIVSDRSLPENAAANAALENAQVLSQPGHDPVPALPPIAERISGRTYVLDANPWGLPSISLTFLPGNAVATLMAGEDMALSIGLDNAYRPSSAPLLGGQVIATGAWTSDDEFTIALQLLGAPDLLRLSLQFEADHAIRIEGADYVQHYAFGGAAQE